MQANYNQYRVLYFHIHAVNSFPGPTGDGATVRSGAGTNLKVGAPIRRKAPENVFWSCPSTFLALKVQLVVLASAFVIALSLQFSQFLVCCSYNHFAPFPAICKSGGTCPSRALWSRRHWLRVFLSCRGSSHVMFHSGGLYGIGHRYTAVIVGCIVKTLSTLFSI